MILILGGTGFVGTHLVQRLRKAGLRLRVVVRNPEKAETIKGEGVETVLGDISDPASLEKACKDIERVVHLVGIIQEGPGATFKAVHVEGTRNLIQAAKTAGVRHFFYQSALGTRPNAKSEYHRTKWEAEELVRGSGIPYTILRPSLIYGPGDQFTSRLSEIIKSSPIIPVIGSGRSKIQPIYIEDVTVCIEKIVTSDAFLNEIYEIGGPEQITYEEVTRAIARAMGVSRPLVHVPIFFIKTMSRLLGSILSRPPITTDQIIMLMEDNICSMKNIREAFGVEPVTFAEGLRRFMLRQ